MSIRTKIVPWIFALLAVAAFSAAGQEEKPNAPDFISDQGLITINVENMELSKLMKLLAIKEQVNITSTGPLQGSVCVNLYQVPLTKVLDAALTPNGYVYRVMDGVYHVMKAETLAALETPPPVQVVRIFKLNYLNLSEAEMFIKPLLSDSGQLVVGEKPVTGIPSGSSEAGGDSSAATYTILVKDNEDVVETVAKTLKELDVRPRQVLVEATILEVYLDDDSVLGVDFNALGGIDFADLGSTSNFFSVDVGDAVGEQLEDTIWQGRDAGYAANDPEEGFSFGILNDKVGVFIEALENVVDTNVIANPKVLTLNRQRAEIIIGGRLGYYGAEIVNDGVSQQNVEFLETGTQLRFRPFITDDGFVRLEMHPQRSNGVVDNTTGLPSETTSEVTCNIMVKDGDTVVIGGLIELRDEEIVKRTPFLGSLPLIGWFFSRHETSTRRVEIIVMITPHVLDPAQGNERAEEEIASFERRKQLFREGFLFCSRTIYATKHIAKARTCYQNGDYWWARYHIKRAASLDPNNPAVLPLKEQIEGTYSDREAQEEPMEAFLRWELR